MVVVLVCFTLALLVVLGSLAYLTASTVFAA
jgi:hypothetical protein